ncbi:11S globulin seed storage protein 2-like [Triticum urartu]|uniref:Cupin type-1 domain-containing protein n=1 Tax=Triticum urartu TaxID=4572 RepID=A0A8R7UJH9_TRIUA|nr:11S globulin seed storage protein 2-like [Triticum urartu]XP_048575236.1 11S globulin seed storage protein 2-like [Triticum urartu]
MSAKAGKPLVQTDAGAYIAWSGADQPELATEGLGCGLLVLRPLGFALPHYADSNKFGYVLSGSGVAGVLPVEAKERVVRLKAGDVIVVRTGDVSWWYNDNDGHADDLSILFIGDTARALSPGDISYFFLAGGNSVLSGLDAGLLTRAWPGVTEEQAATAFRSQTAVLLTRLSTKLPGVCPCEHDRKGLVVNAGHVAAGTLKTLTPSDLAALSGLGFSAVLGRLEPGAARPPWVLREGAAQAVYVARGSARVQVSSAAGGDTLLLDEEVPAGSLFVVPRFAVALVAAGADGAEWVSLIKSGRPAVEHLTGEGSIFGGLTPQVVQASLKVAPELLKLL